LGHDDISFEKLAGKKKKAPAKAQVRVVLWAKTSYAGITRIRF
jgi:hypothetical protein